jgi:hypothetical protein
LRAAAGGAAISFRFGGAPSALAEQSLRLYVKEILPVLKSCRAKGRRRRKLMPAGRDPCFGHSCR